MLAQLPNLERAVFVIAGDVAKQLNARSTITRDEAAGWRELATCVLSSQVPYSLAVAAAESVCTSGAFTSVAAKEGLAYRLEKILRTEVRVNGVRRSYRFPAAKSKQLAEGWMRIQSEFGGLSMAFSSLDAHELRIWLVENVPGVGPKQASMFLRNVGVTDEFAVLDRHVIKFMLALGQWRKPPTNLNTLSRYIDRERSVRTYAASIGHSVGVVDWAIWIVMRAASSMGR